jgi:hypothetical protein
MASHRLEVVMKATYMMDGPIQCSNQVPAKDKQMLNFMKANSNFRNLVV